MRSLMLADDAPLTASFDPDLLNGVEVIKGSAFLVKRDEQGQLVKTAQDFQAIPYYSWANRGRSEMMVWIPDSEQTARVQPLPTIASTSKITASPGLKNLAAINDLAVPASSSEGEHTLSDWWPRKGTNAWVEYAFPKESTISSTSVYWFDDTGTGECRVPELWRILYKDGDQWKPVETTDTYGVDRNKYNKIAFTPVTTTGLRLEVKMRQRWSTGIQEWTVP